jgi:hypothetical protein
MNAELVAVIDNMGLVVAIGVATLGVIGAILWLVVKELREIKFVLKDLVAETAYLATIEDEDEDETEEK